MKWTMIDLRVPDVEAAQAFYRDLLGMAARDNGLGFDNPDEAVLRFHAGAKQPYAPARTSFYWKIGLTVDHLDSAVAWLRQRGCRVSEPSQFRDIGYLAHLSDPCGLTIELLQRGFEGHHTAAPSSGHPIGAQATLAHITLRIRDLAPSQAFCESRLGMRLVSVQPVAPFGFTLYFYSWRDDTPPEPDLKAVANREWLWRRRYTILELQHLESPGPRPQRDAPDACGLISLAYQSEQDAVALSLDDLDGLC